MIKKKACKAVELIYCEIVFNFIARFKEWLRCKKKKKSTDFYRQGFSFSSIYMYCCSVASVCRDSLEYFLSLQSDSHREAWGSLMILLITRLLKLPDDRVSSLTNANSCYNLRFDISLLEMQCWLVNQL